MSDEEKEAIKWLKRLVKINKRDNLDNTFAEILLNLIEKQSNEIEEYNTKLLSNAGIYQLGFSEEEKKAIERIDYIQDFIIENGQYNADVNDMQYFSKVLNVIKKQSKEIEEIEELKNMKKVINC